MGGLPQVPIGTQLVLIQQSIIPYFGKSTIDKQIVYE
jgi:hypothetical protein